jgi:hypothetical protein
MFFSGSCKAVRDILFDVREKHNRNSLIRLLGEIRKGDHDLFKRIIKTNKHNHASLFAVVARNNEFLTREIARKRRFLLQDPIVLLAAAVQGTEYWASDILIADPMLILNKSATIWDLSGKEIKGLTPLQAAICAGDVGMFKTMKRVLQQPVRTGVTLSFDPEAEIARQFDEIFPEGIDLVVTAQKDAADEFKKTNLEYLFNLINAATADQVRYELDHPGQELNNPDGKLNKALHNFRREFTDLSNQEKIFNPYYLVEAFEFYDTNFDKFNKPMCRVLYWCQVIGYIQRHLPACLWQAFAQSIYDIVAGGRPLERSLIFKHDPLFKIHLDNLGYKWCMGIGGPVEEEMTPWYGLPLSTYCTGCDSSYERRRLQLFKDYCEQKQQFWRACVRIKDHTTTARLPADTQIEQQTTTARLPPEPARNRERYSCCHIC